MKAATTISRIDPCSSFISIHAAREGGDCLLCVLSVLCYISIHAAREGGDFDLWVRNRWEMISIHAAREGGDSGDSPV